MQVIYKSFRKIPQEKSIRHLLRKMKERAYINKSRELTTKYDIYSFDAGYRRKET